MPQAGRVALDSNVAIAALRRSPAAVAWFLSLGAGVLPVPVVSEIRFGALNSSEPAKGLAEVETFVRLCGILPLSLHTAEIAADIRIGLRRRGRPIPANDVWIAASAIEHGLPLATRDDHLLSLPGVQAFKPF